MVLADLVSGGGGGLQTGPFGSQLHAHDYDPGGPVRVIPTSAVGPGRLLIEETQRISMRMANALSRHIVKRGDIVFARRGAQATGLSSLVRPEQEGWLAGTGVIRARFNQELVEPAFLSFVLRSEETKRWIRQHAIGATMPNLNEGVIKEIPLLLPELGEQRRIAAILGALDDKIEVNRKMNSTLEAMAWALFKSWFVDFDGHDDLVDSEIGPIPRGWRIGKVGDHLELAYGKSLPEKVRVAGPVPVYSSGGRSGWHSKPLAYSMLSTMDISRLGADSAVPGVNRHSVLAQLVSSPPLFLVAQYAVLFSPIRSRITVNNSESRTLTTLRDTLLPKLISGEIRVPEAESAVSDVL